MTHAQFSPSQFSRACMAVTGKLPSRLLAVALSSLLSTLLLLAAPSLASASGGLFANDKPFGAQAEPEFLKVDEAFLFHSESDANGLQLHWDIADDYYLYLERFKFKVSTAANGSTSSDSSVVLGEAEFSQQGEKKEDPYFGAVHVIHDTLRVHLPITLAAGQNDAEIRITYQGCAEAGLCYPPRHQHVLYIPAADGVAPPTQSGTTGGSSTDANRSVANNTNNALLTTATGGPSIDTLDNASGVFSFLQSSNLWAIAGIFFLLGIGLTFTPCVFPMIPIISSIIAGQQHPTVSKSFLLALCYVLGMAVTYAAAGVATGLLGAGANVQAALQDPILLSVFAAVFVALALAMFGVYELQLPAFVRDRLNTTSQQLSGGKLGSVFAIGALSALVVSPCVSAPLAGALLYISSTGDAMIGGMSLFALGLGMGVPLILIAVGGGKLLPKAGNWMNQVKVVFGVMLMAVAIWLLSRFLPGPVTLALWAILLGLTAAHMGAFEAANKGWPRLAKGSGLVMAFYAAMLLVGAATGANDPLRPLESLQTPVAMQTQNTSSALDFALIYDEQGLAAKKQVALETARPMMVDFYADWCISCKIMEDQVFPQPQIASKLAQFKLVKADVTDNTAANQALMDRFGLFGPPSILFFDSAGNELRDLRIVGEITARDFEQHLIAALTTPADAGAMAQQRESNPESQLAGFIAP